MLIKHFVVYIKHNVFNFLKTVQIIFTEEKANCLN